MSALTAHFAWYELVTTDPAAARAFYGEVMGWRLEDSGLTDRRYTILSVGETAMGGLLELPAEARAMGARPCWMGYVTVDDVDAFVDRVVAAGGVVHRAAEDIPGVGRFAVVADLHGAPFVLFRGAAGAAGPTPAPMTPGFVGWHELRTGDLDSGFAFYAGLFGWTRTQAIDMGPMGIYQLFATGGEAVGGMMAKTAEMPIAFWIYYFTVAGIDAAASRVLAAGGKVVQGPHEVPGGAWIVHCFDPQGAMFALVSAQR